MANILLVEPDTILARTYRRALESSGREVRAVSSAQAGISAADQAKPDVVLVELQLVAHSGVEFIYEFRSYSDWQEVPVIVLSQVPPAEFDHNKELLAQLGVTIYLYKPQTSLSRLLEAVSQVEFAT